MSDNNIKRLYKKFITGIIFLIIIIIALMILAFKSSYSVLITDTNSKFFTAKYLMISGDYLFCFKDSMEFRRRKDAVANTEHKYAVAYMAMRDIANIEIIPDDDEPVVSGTADIKYFGKYKIDVSGNIGFLYLGAKNGKVYGSVRFPDWGNGAFEPCKNLWINKGKIGFIRSVESMEEAKRVGSNGYFTQEFHGEYKDGGNSIQGYYLNRGANMMWRAFKLK